MHKRNNSSAGNRQHRVRRVLLGGRWRWAKRTAWAAVAIFAVVLYFNTPGIRAATATVVPISDVAAQWTPSTGTSNYPLVDEGTTPSTTDYVHTGTGINATLLPVSDIQTGWSTSTGTTHYTLVDEGATPNTADYVTTGTGGTATETDEYGLTAAPAPGPTSTVIISVYAESATNANGGTLDTLNINLKVNGTTQTASTCTPAYNTWGWCTATFSGSWTSTDVTNMSVILSDTIQGSGKTTTRQDDLRVADAYASFSSNSLVTDEYGLSNVPAATTASQMVLNVYAESATNANGGTLDTLSINLKVNGVAQTAATCTPAYNTWGWCTATFSGSWISADVANMHALISNTVNGSGSPEDDIEVADIYGTLTYNSAPAAPALNTPANGAASLSAAPTFTFSTTDSDSDYLKYKISIYQSDCSTLVATADQTSSQTGWSGQDASGGTAYASGTTATYTYQGTLSPGIVYCWGVQAIDPAGSNTWSTASGTRTFTTDYTPAVPTLSTPASGAISVSRTPQFTLRTTDADSDYLRYRIYLYQSDCSTLVATADQTSSQTGWSGQDQQGGTAYSGSTVITSSTVASYVYQGTLSVGTTYCWRAQAIDPGGSNTWSPLSATQSFTTNAAPAAPTLSTPSSGATGIATSPVFTLRTTDADSDYLRYRIYLYQSDCSTLVATADQTSSQTGWSGQDASGGTAYAGGAALASSTPATYTYSGTLFANTAYCWQAQAVDPGGSNAWSPLSATQLFTTNGGPTMVNLGGNLNIRGGTRFGN